MSSSRLSHAFHMDFSKEGIEMMVGKRSDYYKTMMEKLENRLPNLEFKHHQVITYSTLPNSGRGSLESSSSAKNMNQNLPLDTAECDESSMEDEYSYLEDSLDSSECSSIENYGEEEKTDAFFHDPDALEKMYLSALEIKSDTNNIQLKNPSQDGSLSTMVTESDERSNNAESPVLRV
ncbi:uncharacterized protein LOC143546886 [Bidens hawaiensis]|uniref:uncharacterized protein LOC143546886 n=1 Tax=Bidens hawaiensis TaxID=980011 RepID=UPI0040496592